MQKQHAISQRCIEERRKLLKLFYKLVLSSNPNREQMGVTKRLTFQSDSVISSRGGGGGGGTQVQKVGRTRVMYFAEEVVFF